MCAKLATEYKAPPITVANFDYSFFNATNATIPKMYNSFVKTRHSLEDILYNTFFIVFCIFSLLSSTLMF